MRRNKEEIMTKILEICARKDGANKTGIVYGANLNFRTAAPYLDLLLNKGYIEDINGKFKITPMGEMIVCQ